MLVQKASEEKLLSALVTLKPRLRLVHLHHVLLPLGVTRESGRAMVAGETEHLEVRPHQVVLDIAGHLGLVLAVRRVERAAQHFPG